MRTYNKDVWFLNTQDYYVVDKRATKKGYDVYKNSDTGQIYFSRKKHAEKVAKYLDLCADADVYHTTLEFVAG